MASSLLPVVSSSNRCLPLYHRGKEAELSTGTWKCIYPSVVSRSQQYTKTSYPLGVSQDATSTQISGLPLCHTEGRKQRRRRIHGNVYIRWVCRKKPTVHEEEYIRSECRKTQPAHNYCRCLSVGVFQDANGARKIYIRWRVARRRRYMNIMNNRFAGAYKKKHYVGASRRSTTPTALRSAGCRGQGRTGRTSLVWGAIQGPGFPTKRRGFYHGTNNINIVIYKSPLLTAASTQQIHRTHG